MLHLELAAQPPTPLLCGCAHTPRPFPRVFNWPNAVLRVALLLLVCSSDSQVNERDEAVSLAIYLHFIFDLDKDKRIGQALQVNLFALTIVKYWWQYE